MRIVKLQLLYINLKISYLTSVISFNNYIFTGLKDLLLIDMTLFHLLLPHKIATCKLVFFIVVMGGIIDDFVNERQMALDFGFAL